MKFTLSWLKDHLETKASLTEIVATLTRIGLEVEYVENPAEALRAFVIAFVVEAKPHPNADRLQSAWSMPARARRFRSSAVRPMREPASNPSFQPQAPIFPARRSRSAKA